MSQSNMSADAQAQCATEAAVAMTRAAADHRQRQQQAKHFQETSGTTVASDVCAGQKGEAGGGGPMRYPDAMTKE